MRESKKDGQERGEDTLSWLFGRRHISGTVVCRGKKRVTMRRVEMERKKKRRRRRRRKRRMKAVDERTLSRERERKRVLTCLFVSFFGKRLVLRVRRKEASLFTPNDQLMKQVL